MSEPPIRFDDGAAYDGYMGRWSRLAGERFLDWLAPPPGLQWVDVGCGNGAFDAAVMALALFLVPDPARGVAEMARVVRPGGSVSAYAWDIVGGGFPYAAMAQEMRELGAGLVEVQTLEITVRRSCAPGCRPTATAASPTPPVPTP